MALLNIPFIHRATGAARHGDSHSANSPSTTHPSSRLGIWNCSMWSWAFPRSSLRSNPDQLELLPLRKEFMPFIERQDFLSLLRATRSALSCCDIKNRVDGSPALQGIDRSEQLRALARSTEPSLSKRQRVAAELQAVLLGLFHDWDDKPSTAARGALQSSEGRLQIEDATDPLCYGNRSSSAASLLHAHQMHIYPVGVLLVRAATKYQVPVELNATQHALGGWAVPLVAKYLQKTRACNGEVYSDYPFIPCRSAQFDIGWWASKRNPDVWQKCFSRLVEKGLRSDCDTVLVVDDFFNGPGIEEDPREIKRSILKAFNETIGILGKSIGGCKAPPYKLRFTSDFAAAYTAIQRGKIAGIISDLYLPSSFQLGQRVVEDIFLRTQTLPAEQTRGILKSLSGHGERVHAALQEVIAQKLAEN
jgi:hypothetical protein